MDCASLFCKAQPDNKLKKRGHEENVAKDSIG